MSSYESRVSNLIDRHLGQYGVDSITNVGGRSDAIHVTLSCWAMPTAEFPVGTSYLWDDDFISCLTNTVGNAEYKGRARILAGKVVACMAALRHQTDVEHVRFSVTPGSGTFIWGAKTVSPPIRIPRRRSVEQ